jgi:hypothetical protein
LWQVRKPLALAATSYYSDQKLGLVTLALLKEIPYDEETETGVEESDPERPRSQNG